jgi:hypothetical protein
MGDGPCANPTPFPFCEQLSKDRILMADDDKPMPDEETIPADDMPPADGTSSADDEPAAQPETEEPTPVKTVVRTHKTRRWGLTALLLILLVPALVFGTWAWVTLNYSYSKGIRAGYIQKLSRKGWLCKTWEGELAMVNLPGTMPEIFRFSVRNDSIARLLEKNVGKRVSLFYEEHRGVPTSCFAETGYYVTNVRQADQ